MKNFGFFLPFLLCSSCPLLGGCSDDDEAPATENDRSPFDPPITELDCSNFTPPMIAVIGSVISIDGTSLILNGTADSASNFAIRQVRVGAVPARRDTFNFRTWTATIPYSSWSYFPRSEVTFGVPVSVDDACGTPDLVVQAPIPQGALGEEPPGNGGDGGGSAAQ